jgi:hypothetical protein
MDPHDPDVIRERIVKALEMREKYNVEFEDLSIKHAMVLDIEQEDDIQIQAKLKRDYEKSRYYTL